MKTEIVNGLQTEASKAQVISALEMWLEPRLASRKLEQERMRVEREDYRYACSDYAKKPLIHRLFSRPPHAPSYFGFSPYFCSDTNRVETYLHALKISSNDTVVVKIMDDASLMIAEIIAQYLEKTKMIDQYAAREVTDAAAEPLQESETI